MTNGEYRAIRVAHDFVGRSDRQVCGCTGKAGFRTYSQYDEVRIAFLGNLKNGIGDLTLPHDVFDLAPGFRFRRDQASELGAEVTFQLSRIDQFSFSRGGDNVDQSLAGLKLLRERKRI